MAINVTDFEKEVLDVSTLRPVVVDFWAAWCGPCKTLGPVLERLEGEAAGRWVLAKVDTDKNQELAVRFGIRGIPAVKMFIERNVIGEFTGAVPEAGVRKWLTEFLPDPDAPMIERLRNIVLAGEGRTVLDDLKALHQRLPNNHKVRVLLARVLMDQEPEEASALLADIEQDSKEYQEAEALRMHLRFVQSVHHEALLPDDAVKPLYLKAMKSAIAGDYTDALDAFIEVIRRNRTYDDDGARRACVAIFTLLGEEHPLTKTKRREFSGALY